jgi:hypothetical protein
VSYTPDNVFNFCQVTYVPDNEFHFGECNAAPPAVELNSNAIVTLPTVTSTSSFFYNSMVSRQLSSPTHVAYSTAVKTHFHTRLPYVFGKEVTRQHAVLNIDAKPVLKTARIQLIGDKQINYAPRCLFADGNQINSIAHSVFANGVKTPTSNRVMLSNAIAIDLLAKARYFHAQPIPVLLKANYTPAHQTSAVKRFLFNNTKGFDKQLYNVYTHGKPITAGSHVPIPVITTTIVPRPCGNNFIFVPFNGVNEFRFKPCPSGIYIPNRGVYYVPNTFSLMAGATEIRVLSFNLSLDSESFCWQWSATIDPAQFANIISFDQLNPIDVVATINGVPFNLIIEKVSTDRSYCSKSLSISGRGRTAYLSAPYAEISTAYSAAAITAQQAAEAALSVNNVPIGWTVDWGIDDWLIGAGAWSNTGTYIEHLARIAEAGGGYLQPHDTADTIKFKKYYPTMPWEWDTADIVLPEAVVVTEGIEYGFKPVYNGVYIHGGASSGRLDLVKRTSTPGDKQAPIVVDDLATDTLMTTQRGSRVLGDTGAFAMLSLSLPILSETGIIRPGTMIQYLTRYGMVRGVSVSLGNDCKPKQTIEVETHEYL